MKPTKITNLIALAIVVAIASYFLIQQLIGSGLPSPSTSLNLVLLQPVLAIILGLAAIPMIRYRRGLRKFEEGKGKRPKLVEPGYAVRILALAKAVSLTGSIFVGWVAAILIHELSRAGSALMSVLGIVGAISMVIVGVIVELLFRIPPDRDGESA